MMPAPRSANEMANVADLVNGSPSGENVGSIAASGTILADPSALGQEKASSDAVDGNGTNGAQNVLLDGDESRHTQGESPSPNIEFVPKQNDEAKTVEATEPAEQEHFQDEDDDDGSGGDSDILEEPVADGVQAPVRPKRYELSYWAYHLARAEKLWSIEEREKSDEWKELWKLVIRFLCESPEAFKTWQQHYTELGKKYDANDKLLSPLQVAAAYHIPGLVKILLDRGESATAELEDGRSALWFGADSPDIEVIKLLLEEGANPNALKDFPPPFHVLLKWNPKIEFVSLMLEHGADCKIADQWGFTAFHFFALYGSDVEVFEVLLKAHGEINATDSY